MAHKLNKHTPNSDELLKRLESNDSSGLDDFEKEALEGFDSLENVELAKNLSDSLNKKIDEKYLNKEGGNKKGLMYLSMAAGLVLVVGLSIFFMNVMGDKKEVAMSSETKNTEQIVNEVSKPTDLAPASPKEEPAKSEGKAATGGDGNTVTVNDALAEKTAKGAKDISNLDARANNQPDKDDVLTSRMVVKEKKPADANKLEDAEREDSYKKQESDKSKFVSGPPAGNIAAAPSVVAEEQKASPVQTSSSTKAKDEPANEKVSLSKNNNNNVPHNDLAAGGKSGNADAKKPNSPEKKERRKEKSGEALGTDDVAANDETTVNSQSNVSQTVGGVATENKRDESGYYHTTEYRSRSYAKPQDYIKVEIDKSEMLKTNVKAFKAELTINEKGIVTAVKFLTAFDNCTGCKKELEKVLLNMPGWKAATKGEKTVTETVSFIYP